jgi:ribosome maturation factor RimP
MSVQNQLEAIVAKVLEEHPGIFLVESIHGKQTHEFIIDGDQPLGIYDISAIGRSINHFADEAMPEENYTLDVGSPGADSDIKLLRQYPKHIGREFSIILKDDTELKGKLISLEGEVLTIEHFENPKPKRHEKPVLKDINFNDIKKANIILSFK